MSLTPACWKPSSRHQATISSLSAAISVLPYWSRSVVNVRSEEVLEPDQYNRPDAELARQHLFRRRCSRNGPDDDRGPWRSRLHADDASREQPRCARPQRFPDARRWQIICGAGNNGGDGYVVARLAAQQGIVVSVLALVDPDKLTGDAATAWGDFAAEGGVVCPGRANLMPRPTCWSMRILGSGLERDVGGEFADAVAAINAHPAPVLALDIPTGIHGDTRQVMGSAVQADLTVTFVGLKSGLFLGEAPAIAAHSVRGSRDSRQLSRRNRPGLSPIDDCSSQRSETQGARRAQGRFRARPGRSAGAKACRVPCVWPARPRCGAGAGRVSIATHPTTRPFSSRRGRNSCRTALQVRRTWSRCWKGRRHRFGPGLGSRTGRRRCMTCRTIIDARCLGCGCPEFAGAIAGYGDNRVMTPHPGEAATLAGYEHR